MKVRKVILLFFLFSQISVAFAQTLTYGEVEAKAGLVYKKNFYKEYIASDGTIIKVGDVCVLGDPSIMEPTANGKVYLEYTSVYFLAYGIEVAMKNTVSESFLEKSNAKMEKRQEELTEKEVQKAADVMTIDKIYVVKKGDRAGQVCISINYLLAGYHIYVEQALATNELMLTTLK